MSGPRRRPRHDRPRQTPNLADALERRVLLAAASFGAPADYGSGSSLGPVLADLTGGGLPDVVSPNSAGGAEGVTVFTNADGVLGTGTSYDTGSPGEQPFQLATADFDGDGHADVASANFDTGLSVLFGDGTGALGRLATYAAGSEPDGIVTGDFNGDGHPDIAVSNRGSDNVSVFLNNGDGTFAPAVNYAVGASPANIAVGDLNGDGHLDLVTADGNGVSILLGNGNGTFAAAVPVSTAHPSTYVAVADMNGDTHPDLVVADNGPGVEVLLNMGTAATFAAPIETPVADTFSSIVVADFNGDGIADVAGASNATTSVSVLQGTGTGSFQAEQVFPTGLPSYSLAAGDLNGDGKPDLVVGSYGGGSQPAFATLLNTGTFTGTPTPTPTATKTIGGLDPTFGTGGLASHDVGFTATTGVAADGAGSVLVGPIGASPSEQFGITRYNGDGSLDTTFGTAGVTATPFGSTDAVPTAVAVLSDGDVLVAGTATTYAASGAAAGSEFAVAEYTSAGTLDPSFGTGGTQLVSFSSTAGTLSDDVARAMAVGAGGVIYLGGSSDAAGQGNTDLAVAALTSAGALDTAFGAGGESLADVAGGNDAVNGLAVQPNGAVVAAGSATVGGVVEVALARFLATGKLDPHFGTKGVVTTKVGGVYDEATSVALQPKGQIVVGGLTATGSGASLSSDFLVQRYTAAGRPDDSFGTRGTVTTRFGQPAAVTQVVLQSDGSIVASGRTSATLGGTLDVAVARYTTAGKLDASFAGVGKVAVDLSSGVVATPAEDLFAAAAVDLGAAFDAFVASEQGVVAVTSGGEILAAGNSGADTVEAELVAAGVDLVARLLSSVPASVLAGAKGTVTVTVTESGTTAAKGSVTITVAFATTASGAAAAATAKPFAERVNLKQGQAHTYKLAFAYPSGLADGGYYLVATVTNGAGLAADLDAANNTAASPAAVTIAPAFVSLSGSALSAVSPLVAGGTAKISIDVTNAGNVTAKGKIDVDVYLSTDGTVADAAPAGDLPVAVGLAVGKSHAYRLTFKLASSVAAATYDLLAVVDPARSLGTVDQTDVSAVVVDASPVVVAAG